MNPQDAQPHHRLPESHLVIVLIIIIHIWNSDDSSRRDRPVWPRGRSLEFMLLWPFRTLPCVFCCIPWVKPVNVCRLDAGNILQVTSTPFVASFAECKHREIPRQTLETTKAANSPKYSETLCGDQKCKYIKRELELHARLFPVPEQQTIRESFHLAAPTRSSWCFHSSTLSKPAPGRLEI